MSLHLAQSGHFVTEFQCPLLGVKRTSTALADNLGSYLFTDVFHRKLERIATNIAKLPEPFLSSVR
jgi:hypothetical protein